MKKRKREAPDLPKRANKLLNGILIVLCLVAIKVWHLSVVQHEKKEEEAKMPQRRVVVEKSERATIYDRFGIPLATNKVQYNATLSYGPIRSIPRSSWKKNHLGRRVKCLLRKEYITKLSQKLAEELNLDAEGIEDLIHSKAAILGNVPCLVKENISEAQYFKLKMMEKDWPGIRAEIGAKRCYPLGSIGGEVIGYIGPISRSEFEAVTKEMATLREALNAYEEGEEVAVHGHNTIEEVALRLEELEKKAYRINDFVGKMGVESAYDEELRGLSGKHIYLADIRGKYLRELPGSSDPTPGSRLILSISSELQSFAGELLAKYESEPFSELPHAAKRRDLIPERQPWIKGGAILAMHPSTGEIYALTSFPTFDPNDFIRTLNSPDFTEKNYRIEKWLETERYLSHIWNMKIPYSRQKYNGDYYEENLELGWKEYLTFILPKKSPLRGILEKHGRLYDTLFVQQKIEELIALFNEEDFAIECSKIIDFLYQGEPHISCGIVTTLQEKSFLSKKCEGHQDEIAKILKSLAPYLAPLSLNYEKLLLIDLYRLVADYSIFDPLLAELLAEMSIVEYREASARSVVVMETIRSLVKEIYLENDFKKWRELFFSDYLAAKREEEKEKNQKYARPYIEYLDEIKKEHFEAFWEANKWDFAIFFLMGNGLVKNEEHIPYATGLCNWAKELRGGAHQGLDWVYHYHRLISYTDELDVTLLPLFLKTLRPFDQLNRSLLGCYTGLRGGKEKHLAAAFYPTYGFGFARSHAYRQATTIGSIFKLVPAYEALKQRYLKLKERGEVVWDLNPMTIIDDKHRVWGKPNAWNVGYTVDGRTIPIYYRGGRLPRSDHAGVGKVDLIRALEASSNPYFAMLVGDVLDDPEDLCVAANLLGYGEKTKVDLPGEYAGRLPIDVAYNRTGLYAMSIGQHSFVGTPLQTAVMLSSIVNGGEVLKPQIVKAQVCEHQIIEKGPETRWRVFMPPQIQNTLLTGLRQVIFGEKGTARMLKRQFENRLLSQVIGKTSTSEVIERMSLDGIDGKIKLKHVWFGGVSYESSDFTKPELVVVVYLRYGEWGGADAAPLAIEMIKKWRELKTKYSSS